MVRRQVLAKLVLVTNKGLPINPGRFNRPRAISTPGLNELVSVRHRKDQSLAQVRTCSCRTPVVTEHTKVRRVSWVH